MTPAGVRAWQRIVGLYGADVDGKWGPKTDAKFRLWEAAKGIDHDGVIGPLCRAAVGPAELINAFEGCVLQAYDDERRSPLYKRLLHRVGGAWFRADGLPCMGVPTIGWGDTAAPRRGVERCTRAQADEWRNQDLERTRMPAIRRYRTPAWDKAQEAAALSFAYNCGTGALAKLAESDFAADHWIQWDKIGEAHDVGLKGRREEEIALFYERDPWPVNWLVRRPSQG